MKRVLILFALLCLGASTQNGLMIDNPVKYPGITQKNYFVTPTAIGGGDCLSWDSACTFRTAVAKLSSSYTTTIFLSGGIHNTDNVGDATGTTISTNNVHICGAQPSTDSPVTRLVNGNAGATHILRITGSNVLISDINFYNSDQADKNVIALNIRASGVEVMNCTFQNSAGDGGGTGILLDNSKYGAYIHNNNFFGVIDSAIEFGAYTDVILEHNKFYAGGKGLYWSSASADRVTVEDSQFLQLTTAIDRAVDPSKTCFLVRCYFGSCTTNIADVASWGSGLWLESITESGMHRSVYPLLAAGVTIAANAAAYTWGNITQIIPTATINKPIFLQSINPQAWSDSGVYQIELYYGNVAGTVSIGVYELTLGATATPSRAAASIQLNVAIPARSYVGARISSSTAGGDTVTLAIGYETL